MASVFVVAASRGGRFCCLGPSHSPLPRRSTDAAATYTRPHACGRRAGHATPAYTPRPRSIRAARQPAPASATAAPSSRSRTVDELGRELLAQGVENRSCEHRADECLEASGPAVRLPYRSWRRTRDSATYAERRRRAVACVGASASGAASRAGSACPGARSAPNSWASVILTWQLLRAVLRKLKMASSATLAALDNRPRSQAVTGAYGS